MWIGEVQIEVALSLRFEFCPGSLRGSDVCHLGGRLSVQPPDNGPIKLQEARPALSRVGSLEPRTSGFRSDGATMVPCGCYGSDWALSRYGATDDVHFPDFFA
ncbi:hypothetical protein AMJ39_07605 [candidate division TA06 bacterium DG_24]|uniref:Uncharacterized protein n=1 Tax=candidate division TA06 bacterium DG_24 TaxID=1703770 RepID=A0A0S7WQU6_UNCT6|nr:MAG: hypothetical protein AMJ39_07605 [candidate division TA06 bacterium DG_24]